MQTTSFNPFQSQSSVGYEPKKPEQFFGHATKQTDRLLGAVLGNAAGDALGAPAEFRSRGEVLKTWPDGLRVMTKGGATGGKDAGSYTDDTEMLVAIMKGILKAGTYDLRSIADEFVAWRDGGPADIGGQTSRAISALRNKSIPIDKVGFTCLSEGSEGNGSIMRNGVVFAFTHTATRFDAMTCAAEISSLTHASQQCRSACAVMTLMQRLLCEATNPKDAIRETYEASKGYGAHPKVIECLRRVVDESYSKASHMPTTGYVIDTLERAAWCLWQDMGFEEGIVTCIMQGGDADSAGAVCGSLLGTYYGASSIPTPWVEAIRASEKKYRGCSIEEMALQVAGIGEKFWATHR